MSNFHSFCHRILTENAADAGLPARPDVLDGVAQVLLLRDILADVPLIYHSRSNWSLGGLVGFINRAKDELVGPDEFDGFVAEERRVFEMRNGSFDAAVERLAAQGNLAPLRSIRGAYAWVRQNERAESRGEAPDYDTDAFEQGSRPRSATNRRRDRAAPTGATRSHARTIRESMP